MTFLASSLRTWVASQMSPSPGNRSAYSNPAILCPLCLHGFVFREVSKVPPRCSLLWICVAPSPLEHSPCCSYHRLLTRSPLLVVPCQELPPGTKLGGCRVRWLCGPGPSPTQAVPQCPQTINSCGVLQLCTEGVSLAQLLQCDRALCCYFKNGRLSRGDLSNLF